MSVQLTKNQTEIKEIAIREFGPNNYDLIPLDNLEIGYSELLMHTRLAGKKAIYAVVNKKNRYAYIFSSDGEWTHGLSYQQGKHAVHVC